MIVPRVLLTDDLTIPLVATLILIPESMHLLKAHILLLNLLDCLFLSLAKYRLVHRLRLIFRCRLRKGIRIRLLDILKNLGNILDRLAIDETHQILMSQ